MVDGVEMAADLLRSDSRIEILERLQTDGMSRYELREAIDGSRTTIDRNLDRLETDGWITKTDRGYAITTAGEFVLERATDFVETVSAADRLQPILRWIPRGEPDIDVRELADAELTTAEEGTPIAMVDKHVQGMTAAAHTRMILPIVSARSMNEQLRATQEQSVHAEHVVTPTVADILQSDPEFVDRIETMRETAEVEIYVTEEPVPYYLGILDETVQIGVDEDGQPRGLIETTAESVREWAERRFESYRESAVPLETWHE